jgi:hypothetical protein
MAGFDIRKPSPEQSLGDVYGKRLFCRLSPILAKAFVRCPY